ncbi:MAG: dihydropteroate synthase, partial [Pseudomonadota bacterium]
TGLATGLMHMRGVPASMQDDPRYDDLPGEVLRFLRSRATACVEAGIDANRIAVDPGFGFGKTDAHNLGLLADLGCFRELGFPLLVGWSRKGTLGAVTGRPVGERLPASLAAAVLAVESGAHIVRVHDVPETVDALKLVSAVARAAMQGGPAG